MNCVCSQCGIRMTMSEQDAKLYDDGEVVGQYVELPYVLTAQDVEKIKQGRAYFTKKGLVEYVKQKHGFPFFLRHR